MEIWRRGRRQHLVGQNCGLVSDAVFFFRLGKPALGGSRVRQSDCFLLVAEKSGSAT